MNDQDEFYIGWQTQASASIGSVMRRITMGILVLLLGLACLLPLAQRTIGTAVFEWGTVKTFRGVLQSQPYPHLLVARPGQAGGQSAYYLVAPLKFGLDTDAMRPIDGKTVTLKGTLIYRGNQTMIEAQADSIHSVSDATGAAKGSKVVSLGRQTFTGEIVDSKCYLGVMNPGRLTPHRACAVRCISGGIPPILLVRRETGAPLYFLLVSNDGRPVNKEVLDMVAEPVEVTGEVVQQGELSILRADPSTYRRVTK